MNEFLNMSLEPITQLELLPINNSAGQFKNLINFPSDLFVVLKPVDEFQQEIVQEEIAEKHI